MEPSAWPPFQSLPWFREYPLRMLVACVLTARTKGSESRIVTRELMREFPTAKDLAEADEESVFRYVERLGFGRRRSRTLIALARKWLRLFEGRWCSRTGYHVWGCLPGCGKYAKDSWEIFVRNNHDVEPTDGVLGLWLKREAKNTTIGDTRWNSVIRSGS